MKPGQISIKDGVHVSRTIIGDPTLTSNDAQHNLSRFWAQQSLNRFVYHHARLQPLLKERNWLCRKTLFYFVNRKMFQLVIDENRMVVTQKMTLIETF